MVSKSFVLAGRAVFTVSNSSGDRYTYQVVHKPGSDRFGPVWFVSLLTGPNNTEDYTYLGILDPEMCVVRLTAKSRFVAGSVSVAVVQWALRHVWTNRSLPDGYAIHHEGKCGRCGRALTVPSSIESGLGPECSKLVSSAVGV